MAVNRTDDAFDCREVSIEKRERIHKLTWCNPTLDFNLARDIWPVYPTSKVEAESLGSYFCNLTSDF